MASFRESWKATMRLFRWLSAITTEEGLKAAMIASSQQSVPGPTGLRKMTEEQVTNEMLDYLHEKYGELFQPMDFTWNKAELTSLRFPTLVARPLNSDSALDRFKVRMTLKRREGSLYEDDYMAVTMAHDYSNKASAVVAPFFAESRVVVWLSGDVTGLDPATSAESLGEYATQSLTAEVLVGVAVSGDPVRAALEEMLAEMAITLHDTLPAKSVTLKLRAYPEKALFDHVVSHDENVAKYHDFELLDSGRGVWLETSWIA